MNNDVRKQAAMKLRLSGASYNDIQKKLGIPKATLSNWFSKMELPKKVLLMIEQRGKERATKVLVTLSRASQGKRPFNRLEYGVAQVVVGDTPLFHKIMGHIEGLKKFV